MTAGTLLQHLAEGEAQLQEARMLIQDLRAARNRDAATQGARARLDEAQASFEAFILLVHQGHSHLLGTQDEIDAATDRAEAGFNGVHQADLDLERLIRMPAVPSRPRNPRGGKAAGAQPGMPAGGDAGNAADLPGLSVLAGNPGLPAAGEREASQVNRITGAVRLDGKVYFSEGADHVVRVLDLATRAIQTVVGIHQGPDKGHLAAAGIPRLNNPGALAIVNHGGRPELLICDRGTHTLKVFALDGAGEPMRVIGRKGNGGYADGPSDEAEFGTLTAITVMRGYVFVADLESGIRMIDLDRGLVQTLNPAMGDSTDPRDPIGLAADEVRNRIFVTTRNAPGHPGNTPNDRIQVLLPDDPARPWESPWKIRRFAGAYGPGDGDGITGTLAGQADYTPIGNQLYVGTTPTTVKVARFNGAEGLGVHGDFLYVTQNSPHNHSVRRINLTGNPPDRLQVTTLGTPDHAYPGKGYEPAIPGPLPGMEDTGANRFAPDEPRFDSPSLVLPGEDGNAVLVVDQKGQALRRIDIDVPLNEGHARLKRKPWRASVVSTLIRPSARAGRSQDGMGPDAMFNNPRGIAVERSTGEAFVADSRANAIRRVAPGSGPVQVRTFAGELNGKGEQPAPQENLDGARFNQPYEIGIDGWGRQYVMERGGALIRMIDKGQVATILDLPPTVQPNATAHMAVRPGGYRPDPAREVPGQPLPAGGPGPESQMLSVGYYDDDQGHWRILAFQFDGTGGSTMKVVAYPENERIRAMAVGLDSRIYVASENRERQICTLHVFRFDDGTGEWAQAQAPLAFGPGTAQGARGGFPDIRALATDSRNNLFVADAANGVIWKLEASSERLFPLNAEPAFHRISGLAFTPQDHLLVTCGDGLLKITQPGTPDSPWQPAVGVREDLAAWKTQIAHNHAATPKPAQDPRRETAQEELLVRAADKAQRNGNMAEALAAWEQYLIRFPQGPRAVQYRTDLLSQYRAEALQAQNAAYALFVQGEATPEHGMVTPLLDQSRDTYLKAQEFNEKYVELQERFPAPAVPEGGESAEAGARRGAGIQEWEDVLLKQVAVAGSLHYIQGLLALTPIQADANLAGDLVRLASQAEVQGTALVTEGMDPDITPEHRAQFYGAALEKLNDARTHYESCIGVYQRLKASFLHAGEANEAEVVQRDIEGIGEALNELLPQIQAVEEALPQP